ncbi:hypothetical protein [Halalkalirubrum salinum]|uniref:hypothetical protein n=1 Tax=Halalkalirubrum salinum TaxID=2563889 RepID=UPI0010FB920C|nr:hypothetical protein [Halalkalirubrum salinum]
MAHDLAHDRAHTDRTDVDSDSSRNFGRRACLRLVSAAISSLVAVTAGSVVSTAKRPTNLHPRVLTITGFGDLSKFRITVDGTLESVAATDSMGTQHVSGSSAEGVVVDDDRRYLVDGDITDLTVDGTASVSVSRHDKPLAFTDAEKNRISHRSLSAIALER